MRSLNVESKIIREEIAEHDFIAADRIKVLMGAVANLADNLDRYEQLAKE